MWALVTVTTFLLGVSNAMAIETKDIIGTWHLVSATKKILDTGELSDAYGGPHPNGWINYDEDGRMMVICAYDNRQKPAPTDITSDSDRIRLQKTFFAYAGTYKFEGGKITHFIDTSWNQSWTGLAQVRNVEYKDGKLIYTTQPQMNNTDGKMNVITLTWERFK